MISRAAMLAAEVIPSDATMTHGEVEAALEIAYLAIAADHRLTDDEIQAFHQVMGRIRQIETTSVEGTPYRASAGDVRSEEPVSERTLNETLDAFAQSSERVDVDARLRALAAKLSAPARQVAYKIAHAIALADLESSDEEFEFDLQLIDALELTNAAAAALVDEVTATMFAPER
jgi:hypothetical protein